MARAFFTITASVPIAGNPPGKMIQIEVDADGTPADVYWRKRLADGDCAPYAVPRAASEPDPTTPPASAKKKGA